MQSRARLNHQPAPDAPCYTQPGAQAAGSSNLASGSTMADSVGRYVADYNTASLGHRRWVLNPGMRETAFGVHGRGSCMYCFSNGNRHELDYVTWPPAGYIPTAALGGAYSISNYRLRRNGDVSVEVSLNGAPFQEVELSALPPGYGGDSGSWSFRVPNGSGQDRAELAIRVRGLGDDMIEYTVAPIDCDRVLADE